ncbi:MAG: hypothetical protein Q9169_008773, partial [Polycauliona sp. 2 TL-2023]
QFERRRRHAFTSGLAEEERAIDSVFIRGASSIALVCRPLLDQLAIFAVFAICAIRAILNVTTNFTISPRAGVTIPTASTSMASTLYLLLVLLITPTTSPQTTYVDAEELDSPSAPTLPAPIYHSSLQPTADLKVSIMTTSRQYNRNTYSIKTPIITTDIVTDISTNQLLDSKCYLANNYKDLEL